MPSTTAWRWAKSPLLESCPPAGRTAPGSAAGAVEAEEADAAVGLAQAHEGQGRGAAAAMEVRREGGVAGEEEAAEEEAAAEEASGEAAAASAEAEGGTDGRMSGRVTQSIRMGRFDHTALYHGLTGRLLSQAAMRGRSATFLWTACRVGNAATLPG